MVFTLILAFAAIGLQILARLLYKDKGPALDSDQPATTSSRGSYVPVKVGRRLSAPVIATVWDTEVRKEKAEGAKKGPLGGTPKTDVYYEAACHWIQVGPVRALHRIYSNGKVIFDGPITPESTPSGSAVGSKGTLGKTSAGLEGTFRIFWGEPDQPVNTIADYGDSSLEKPLGIASRWPHVCYVVWYKKRLGVTKHWPEIKYEVESYPTESHLSGSSSVFPATRELYGSAFAIEEANDGAPGHGNVLIDGDQTALFRPSGWLLLMGNAAGDGDYQILDVAIENPLNELGVVTTKSRIYFITELVGSDDAGTVEPYVFFQDDGVNPVHALGQFMFATYPHGIGLPTDGEWSLTSLESVGVLAEGEGLAASVEALNGQTAKGLVAAVAQDLGLALPQIDGVVNFFPIREVDPDDVPTIPEEAIVPQLARIESALGPLPVNTVIFTYKDRSRNFRDSTVRARNDSEARLSGRQDPRTIPLAIAIDSGVASKISERRTPEEIGGQAAGFAIFANHGVRDLFPGRAFRAEGIPGLLRCGSVVCEALSGKTRIDATLDRYSQPASTLEHEGGSGTATDPSPGAADLLFGIYEVPSFVSPGVQRLAIPRIRGNSSQVGADFWLSLDDSTYVHVGRQTGYQTGGTLLEDLSATDEYADAEGPTFEPLGGDIALVPDLSTDHPSWGAGRVAVLFEGSDEVCYLQKITFVAKNVWRLDGLLRARQDTRRAAHVAGTRFFIVPTEDTFTFTDVLLAPGVTVYVKTQPYATTSYPLQLVDSRSAALTGKGIIPMAPGVVTTADLSDSFGTGEDVELVWQFRSDAIHGTGAGMQGAGLATGSSPQDGAFELVFKTTGGTVKATYDSDEPSFTYSNADLVADFGSEPSAFNVEVRNVNGGYRSPASTRRITRT